MLQYVQEVVTHFILPKIRVINTTKFKIQAFGFWPIATTILLLYVKEVVAHFLFILTGHYF